MTILDSIGRARHTPVIFLVESSSGKEYMIDLDAVDGPVCECADHQHRGVECKHIWRARYATGRRGIITWVDRSSVDAQLGQHVDGGPRFKGNHDHEARSRGSAM